MLKNYGTERVIRGRGDEDVEEMIEKAIDTDVCDTMTESERRKHKQM